MAGTTAGLTAAGGLENFMEDAVLVRAGGPDDEAAVLALWDRAIAWLAGRGQTGQWGSQPASARPQAREMVRDWTTGTGLRVAELDGTPAGVSVIADTRPDYIPATDLAETYLLFMVSDRARSGRGVGSALVRRALEDARAAGSQVLRVDCWAGAPDLVAWYERQGFTRSGTFTVGGSWRGQLFEQPL